MKKFAILFLFVANFCLAQTHPKNSARIGQAGTNQRVGDTLSGKESCFEATDTAAFDNQVYFNLQRGFGVGVAGLDNNGRVFWSSGGGGGGGTVTNLTVNNFTPLFTTSVTNPTTTPTVSFTATSILAHRFYGNATSGTTTPSFSLLDTTDIVGFTVKVRHSFSAIAPLVYTPSTGVFTTSVTQDKLLGRGATSGTGVMQEITLGTNLSMSGTTLNATGGGGGGDIKSDGSVNFVKSETWTKARVSYTTIDSTQVRTETGQTATVINDNGTITLIDSLGTSPLYLDQSATTIFSGKAILSASRVQHLFSAPQNVVISLGAPQAIVITNIVAQWQGGSTSFGIPSLYLYSAGSNSNQYQIDCPVTVAPYCQRGAPIQTLIGNKDNVFKAGNIKVTSDFDTGSGDSELVLYIWGIIINLN